MTQITYDIRIYDAFGQELRSGIDCESFDLSLKEMDVGALSITLPASFPFEYLKKDGQIALFRSIAGNPPSLLAQAHWVIRARTKTIGAARKSYTIGALHANCLLDRRNVAYNANTSQTSKNDEADDLVKAVVRENLGSSATDTARQIASTLFSVQGDMTQAPVIQKAFTRRNVLSVCQEVAAASATAGTYLGFEIYAATDTMLEFRTYTGHRGVDHTADSLQPVYLPLDSVTITDDWREEITYVYAAGLGIGANRAIGTASNTVLSNESPFGRIEYFWDGKQTGDTAVLNDEAEAQLRMKRPRRIITGAVQQIDGALFGIHYNFGDLCAIAVDGEVRDVRLDTIGISYSRGGGERITINVRSEA